MPNTSVHTTPRSQKILRGLSFLSLAYLAYVMCAFIYAAYQHSPGFEKNFLFVILAVGLAGLFLVTAVKQLFGPQRRLILITSIAVVLCNIGQIVFLKILEASIIELRPEGFISHGAMYPIWMIMLISIPWYLALAFPVFTHFRRPPASNLVAA